MASGTIKSSFTGDYGLEIRWTSVPDVATNTSQVTMKVYMLYPSIKVSKRSGCYTTIDGKKVEFSAPAIDNEYKGETLIKTRTETVAHDSDGTKKIQLVAYYPVYLNSESYGWIYEKKASGTAVLDDIPRSSSIVSQSAAVTANGTDKWAVMVGRHSDAFWHKATLSIGDKVHVTEPFATTAEYAIPTEWLNVIPDAMRGTVNVSIQTYSDSTCGTAVGDAITSSFEIVVPSTAAPVIKDGWATVTPYNTGAVSAFSGIYVQGYSQAQVTFDAGKVSAQYGADIISTQISWDGNVTEAAPYRTPVLSKGGNQAVKCTVTDSRGLKSTKELTVNVLTYAKPMLNNISIYRSTSGGTASDTGTYIYFKATGVYSSLNGKNTLTMKAAYRAVGATSWTESSITSGTGAAKGTVSTTNSYEARITAVDTLGNTATFSAVIPTADVAFNIKPGGKGAAFGKYAELENVLDVDFMSRFRGGILHPVLEAKTDLNNILTPNTYVGTEAGTSEYMHCPVTSGSFSLEVVGMGEEGNVRQRLQLFSKTAPVTYERFRSNVQPIDITGESVDIEVSQRADVNVVTTIEPVQTGSGDPSPDNVRAITGFDSATLTRCGKNLFDLNSAHAAPTSTTKLEITGNTVRVYTTANTKYGSLIGNTILVKKGYTYTLSGNVTALNVKSTFMSLCVRNAETNSTVFSSGISVAGGVGTYSKTFTPTADTYVYPSLIITSGTAEAGDITMSNIMLEINNAATNYEPYNGNAFFADFGQTVYGGTLNWNTGVLTVDKKSITLDGDPNILWRITSSGKAAYTEEYISGAKIVGNYDIVGTSSHAPVSETTGAIYRGAIMCAYAGGKGLQMALDYFGISSPTVAAFNAFLAAQYAAGTPVQICYKLSEPITIQLTPQEIYALPGRNTFSCDAGVINVRNADPWGAWMNTMLYNYPVGSLYTSSNPTSPAEIMGGVWVQIKDRFILAAGDTYAAGSTGGEAEHTLTENELPVIDGTIAVPVVQDHATSGVTGHAYGANDGAVIWTPTSSRPGITGTKATSGAQYGYGYKFGGGEAHNNMPPYKAYYVWERIA